MQSGSSWSASALLVQRKFCNQSTPSLSVLLILQCNADNISNSSPNMFYIVRACPFLLILSGQRLIEGAESVALHCFQFQDSHHSKPSDLHLGTPVREEGTRDFQEYLLWSDFLTLPVTSAVTTQQGCATLHWSVLLWEGRPGTPVPVASVSAVPSLVRYQ